MANGDWLLHCWQVAHEPRSRNRNWKRPAQRLASRQCHAEGFPDDSEKATELRPALASTRFHRTGGSPTTAKPRRKSARLNKDDGFKPSSAASRFRACATLIGERLMPHTSFTRTRTRQVCRLRQRCWLLHCWRVADEARSRNRNWKLVPQRLASRQWLAETFHRQQRNRHGSLRG